MDEKKILELVAEISAINKPLDNKVKSVYGQIKKYEESKIPEYSRNYVMAVKFLDAIKYHAEYGTFPDELFEKRSPNQTKEELEYIKDNYKQVTLPVFQDLIDTIGRAFNDNNWAISYDASNDVAFPEETFQDYVSKDMPVYGSMEEWLKSILPSIKLKDANGFIVVKPHMLHLIGQEDSEGKIITKIDPDFLPEPIPFYYDCSKVIFHKQDDFILIEIEEKSIVTYSNKEQRMGRIYEFIDTENIYRITQVGKFVDYKFEVSLYYPHELGKLPARVLGGIPRICENKIIYQSPFLFCTDLLDLVLMNYAYLQASINKCVYPYRVMMGSVCDFENNGIHCEGGSLIDFEGHKTTCPECHGSGLRSRVSPLGELLIRPASNTQPGDTGAPFSEFMKYVSPDTKVLEYLDTKITQDEIRARHILHMRTSQSSVKGSENITATDAAIDQKAQYAFIQTISDQIFGMYEWVLNTIGEMRYGDKFLPPSITYPKSFDLQTEADLMTQISEAIKAGLPGFVVHAIIYKFIQSLYYTDKKTTDVFELIVETDRLLILSNDDIILKLARGLIAPWEDVLHTSAIQLIHDLEDKNEKFFEQEFTAKKDQLIQAAKDMYASIQVKPIDLINNDSGGA